MTPYYDDGTVTIYHGDCREVLPGISNADAIVTDPPYGIDLEYASYEDSLTAWYSLLNDVMPLFRSKASVVVLPSCQIKLLPWWYKHHAPDWMIAWYKGSPGHASAIGFNDWEPHLVWGKPYKPMHDFFQTRCGFDDNGHPCPKPIEWGHWLVDRLVPPDGLVIDPFLGSGTVLRAAKDYGRRAIGIEIEERYCEIAAKRLAQEVLPLGGVA